jgi:hypothetical protein
MKNGLDEQIFERTGHDVQLPRDRPRIRAAKSDFGVRHAT